MALEALKNYRALTVDYSVIRELGGTAVFADLLDIIVSGCKDVYVSRSFKLLHYCVLHQADDKYARVADTMKDFCGILLANKQLHSVQATSVTDFVSKISVIDNNCIVTTPHGIFTKRLIEQEIPFSCDICIIGSEGVSFYKGSAEFEASAPKRVISPLASKNKYLESTVFCNVGDTVMTGDQKPVVLSNRISSGAEGMVFMTNNPKIVAKIYHKGVITPLRWSKLTKMVSMGIRSIGICWPQDLLFYKGIPVGYTMLTGKGKTLGNVFDGPDAMVNNFPNWKRVDIVTTLADLLEKYLYLHMNDIVAGDIQMKNALLYSSSSVYLIDMDSVQVENLPCPVGTEEFTDPRLWGNNFSDFLRKLQDEDYSIAMLVFSMLFCGLHPYATRNGAETLREEIVEKNFPYFLDNSSDEHIPKGGYNYIWEYLPDDIRKMLYGVFKEGKRFEAVEWYEAVLAYKDALTSRKIEDEEAYKVFPKMEYHQTADASVSAGKPAPDVSAGNNPFKKKFTGLKDASVYTPGFVSNNTNTSGVSASPASSPFAPIQSDVKSPFAPVNKAPEAAVNTEAEQADANGDNSGIFKKFKKGRLFGN